MMLTPLDIHNKEFKRSFRGYNEDEIDEFLEEIAKDYEVLYRENIDLKENVERLKSKVDNFERLENTLHSTLIVAQETAEEVKANANRESESLRSSANREAGDLRANAKKEAELIVKAAELEAKKMIDAAA
jgi:cell division initiation protein